MVVDILKADRRNWEREWEKREDLAEEERMAAAMACEESVIGSSWKGSRVGVVVRWIDMKLYGGNVEVRKTNERGEKKY